MNRSVSRSASVTGTRRTVWNHGRAASPAITRTVSAAPAAGSHRGRGTAGVPGLVDEVADQVVGHLAELFTEHDGV
ncbi:hypothetical protein, partial [Nonomuraea sp. NPDC050691]|uniref:hypothetical protein n=1 Tax=Nonomuraea sp. NPDC050691 TaxID=3155661 RepID=UPI0033CA3F29